MPVPAPVPLEPRFLQFIREQKFLKNVSGRTCEWYAQSLRLLPSPEPDAAMLKTVVLRMRESGRRASGVNCTCRAINSYLRWSGSPLKIPRLKEEKHLPATYSTDDVTKFLKFRPRGFQQTRTCIFMLTLFDTGARKSEALELRWDEVDMDNLLLKLHGKGRRDRLTPFSFEPRRRLYQWR